MTTDSASGAHDDEEGTLPRVPITPLAAVEENLDLDENDLSRTTTPVDPEAPTPERSETATTVERKYSAFGEGKKWFIVTLAAVGATTSPIGSNIFVPAIPTMSDVFGVSEAKINLTIAIYLIFQGLTPAFWGAAADVYGRRPIFIGTILIFTLASVGQALCPTNAYWLLLLMRIVQSSGASATIAIGAGVISDVARPQERGKYLGIFNTLSCFGPTIGPLLGGVFAGSLGWRSIFWFLVCMGGVILVPMILFMPETLRSLVGDGSVPPPKWNDTPAGCIKRRKARHDLTPEVKTHPDVKATKFQPLSSFLLLLQPDLVMFLLWSSVYYALTYAILTIFSTLLDDIYHFNEIMIGVAYISNGSGVAIGGILTGLLMDKVYQKEKRRVGGDHRTHPEFRLEKVRLCFLPWHAGMLVISAIAMGWTMQAHVHVSVPLIFTFICGLGTSLLTTTTIYAIDLAPGKGGAVTASFNFTRCLLGAVEVGTVQPMFRAMGAGWMFVLLAGICVLVTPLPIMVARIGPRLRRERAEKTKRKEEELAQEREAATPATEQEQEVIDEKSKV